VTALKTSVEDMIVKIESEVSAIQFQLFTETGSTASSLQITAGSSEATVESASDSLLADLKITTLNKIAIEAVVENIKLVVAGTATSGTVEMTAEEYLELVSIFLSVIEFNLLDASIVTQSFALSNAKVTLSTEQITKLTIVQKSFTLVVTQITVIITIIQTSYKELTGAEASAIQISSGSSAVTDAKEASSSLILSLKSITVSKGSIENVEIALQSAVSGNLNEGTEIEGVAFLLLLKEFFAILESDFASSAITAMSFKIINSKVTLTSEQITEVKIFQTTIKMVLIQITISIEFFQAQILTITGSTASPNQILAGDSSESVISVTMDIVVLLKTMTANIGSMKKVTQLLESIGTSAVAATVSGTVEMTISKFLLLIVKFFKMIAENFIVEDLNTVMSEILDAKLTVEELTEIESTDIEFIIIKMEILVTEIMTTIEVLQFQLMVMTGTTYNLMPTGMPTGMMTTRGPGGMSTRSAKMKSDIVRNLLKSSLRKYLE